RGSRCCADQPCGAFRSMCASCSALRTSVFVSASGFRAWMAVPSDWPPLIFSRSCSNGMLRLWEACSAAAHWLVVLKEWQASFMDMPLGRTAASRELGSAAFGAIELCGLVALELPEIGCCIVVIDGSDRDGGGGVSLDWVFGPG